MRFTDIVFRAASLAVVHAGVIPAVNEPLENPNAMIPNKSDSKSIYDTYQLPESVLTYANNWGDNYLTYKYHSLMHRPNAYEVDDDSDGLYDDGEDNGAKETEEPMDGDSGSDDFDDESNEYVDEQYDRYKRTKRDVAKILLSGDTPKNVDTRKTSIKLLTLNESNTLPLRNVSLTEDTSLRKENASKAHLRDGCIAPLEAGSKRLDINGTLNGPSNTTNSTFEREYVNQAGIRPVSCAVLGVAIALAWCTSVL